MDQAGICVAQNPVAEPGNAGINPRPVDLSTAHTPTHHPSQEEPAWGPLTHQRSSRVTLQGRQIKTSDSLLQEQLKNKNNGRLESMFSHCNIKHTSRHTAVRINSNSLQASIFWVGPVLTLQFLRYLQFKERKRRPGHQCMDTNFALRQEVLQKKKKKER